MSATVDHSQTFRHDVANSMCVAIKEADEKRLFALLTDLQSDMDHDAIIATYAEPVKRMLSSSYGVNDICGVEDFNGDTCLHYAARSGHSLVLRFFFNAGLMKSMDQYINREGNTPLHDAVSGQQVVMCRQLLFCGCDPKSKNRSGQTPVSLARKSHNPQLIGALQGKH